MIGRREALEMQQQQQFSKTKPVEEQTMSNTKQSKPEALNLDNSQVRPAVAVKVKLISEAISDNLSETDIALARLGPAILAQEGNSEGTYDVVEDFDDSTDTGIGTQDETEEEVEYDETEDGEDEDEDFYDGDEYSDDGEDEDESPIYSKASMHKIKHKLLVTCSIADTDEVHGNPKDARNELSSIDLGGEYFNLYNPLRAKGTGTKQSPHSFLKAPLDNSILSIEKHHGTSGDVRILGEDASVSRYIEESAESLRKEVTKNLYTANYKNYDLLFSADEVGEAFDSLSDIEEFSDIINNPERYGFTEESVECVANTLTELEAAREEMIEAINDSGEISNIQDIPLDLHTDEDTGIAKASKFISISSMFKVTSWVDSVDDGSVTVHTIVTHISFKAPALYYAVRDGEKNKALTSYLMIVKSRLAALEIPKDTLTVIFGAYVSPKLITLPNEGATSYWSLVDELLHDDGSKYIPTVLGDADDQHSFLSTELSVPLDLEKEDIASMLYPFEDPYNTGILFLC